MDGQTDIMTSKHPKEFDMIRNIAAGDKYGKLIFKEA